tara:strand:+ start:3982 stop:4455 length:474 start_codon:yes stop_codon:yes gene_type:complete
MSDYFSLNGSPVDKNNYGEVGQTQNILYKKPDVPDIKEPDTSDIVHNVNDVEKGITNLVSSCNTYCLPLLIIVVIISLSVLCSLCCDVFKNKKITLNLLIGVIVNILAVLLYFQLCQNCMNSNTLVQIIVADLLPWVIYILVIGLLFMYIRNRVIKK